MTIDEMMKNLKESFPVIGTVNAVVPNRFGHASKISLEEIIKYFARSYATSIIPKEEAKCRCMDPHNFKVEGFNACRAQMLSRIEEDSK